MAEITPQHVALPGAVTLAQCTLLRRDLSAQITQHDTVLDWQAVEEADSSALALILSLMRCGTQAGHVLHHQHVPQSVRTLAALYGLSDLLALEAG